MQISSLSHSPLFPVFVYAFAAVGCLLGLLCVARIETATGWRRAGWWVLAAWAIGGTAAWDMYLLMAVKLEGDGLRFRYAANSIMLGIVFAIASAGVGLLVATARRRSTWASLIGGAILGAAIASSNFVALTALRVNAELSYRPAFVLATVVTAMVGTPAAMVIASRQRGRRSIYWAGALLALVVAGTHYLSLAAVDVGQPNSGPLAGINPINIVIPVTIQIILRVTAFLMVLQGRDTQPTPDNQPTPDTHRTPDPMAHPAPPQHRRDHEFRGKTTHRS